MVAGPAVSDPAKASVTVPVSLAAGGLCDLDGTNFTATDDEVVDLAGLPLDKTDSLSVEAVIEWFAAHVVVPSTYSGATRAARAIGRPLPQPVPSLLGCGAGSARLTIVPRSGGP
jgi:hypothetical protein